MSEEGFDNGGMDGDEGYSGEDLQETGESGEVTRNPREEILDKISRTFKVKIDGEEVEVDEDELIRGYQLRKVSDKRLQDGVKARKQSEALLQMLKTDPRRVLSDPRLGIDARKIAEDIIYEQLQQEMMTPEQRELAQYKKRVQEIEAQEQRRREEESIKQAQMLEEKQRDAYAQDIGDALNNAGLPKNDYTVGRIVHEMTKAIKAGFSNVTAHDVIDLVHSQFIKDTKALYGSSNEETLMKLLGDDVAGKIRNYDIEEYRRKNAIPKSTNVRGKPSNKSPRKKEKPLTPSQLRAKIEAEYGIG